MPDQFIDMLEGVQRPQIVRLEMENARLLRLNAAVATENGRLREGMFRRGVTANGEAWIDCRGCGPLGLAARPAPHEPECWVDALLDRAQ